MVKKSEPAKKSHPYPFDITVVPTGSAPLAGHVQKMNAIGTLVTVKSYLKVGSNVHVAFYLPGTGERIETNGKIMKAYDQLAGSGSSRLIEIHFIGLSAAQKDTLNSFIQILNQAG